MSVSASAASSLSSISWVTSLSSSRNWLLVRNKEHDGVSSSPDDKMETLLYFSPELSVNSLSDKSSLSERRFMDVGKSP